MNDVKGQAKGGKSRSGERFSTDSLIGMGVKAAEELCREAGFPVVLVEKDGGASVLSRAPNRIRLIIRNGIVVSTHRG